jgi:hypothetical protein
LNSIPAGRSPFTIATKTQRKTQGGSKESLLDRSYVSIIDCEKAAMLYCDGIKMRSGAEAN